MTDQQEAPGTARWGAMRLIPLVTVCVLLVLAYAFRERLLVGAARLLTLDDAVAPADYLVVLGGSAEDRPFQAAALYRERLAPHVLVFEYLVDTRQRLGGSLSQTALYQRVLELEGVPAEAIEMAPGVSRTSWDEAQALRRFLGTHRASRVVIVTSAEHTRRAHWTFQKALAGTGVDVRTASSHHQGFDETNWWHRDDGVLVYLHEYLKLPFYLLRYRNGPDVE